MVDHEVSTPCREGYWEILLRNRLHYIYFHTFICKPLPGPYGIKVVTKFLTPRLRLYALCQKICNSMSLISPETNRNSETNRSRLLSKAAFTRQTKVGKLVLENLSWCV